MKVSCSLLFACLLLSGALIGCAGSGSSLDPTRGEGSIPVGRAVSADARDTRVSLRIGEWQRDLTSTPNGMIYAPASMPDGAWQLTITRDGFFPEAFGLLPAQDKTDQFDVVLLPTVGQGEVTGVRFDHPNGIQVRVGENLKLKVVLEGTNVQNKKASLWTSGGVGSLTPGGVFKAKTAGTGTVTADAYGVSATATITVVP